MIEICNLSKCTACNACKVACPKHAINLVPDDLGNLIPQIAREQCIDCGLCIKSCPNNANLPFKTTTKIYAAWSNDDSVRSVSASGGIAYELYRFCLNHNYFCIGVILNEDNKAIYTDINSPSELAKIQNSKYVYSDTNDIFRRIKIKLDDKTNVLFVGLPCHVAGLYSYLKHDYPNLLTVDLMCHGITSDTYFQEHLKTIEHKYKERIYKISFRDPHFATSSYMFSCYNDSRMFYGKRVEEDDLYQLGYHKALTYRNSCYSCKYAQKKRLGDITLGDFSGLGKIVPVTYEVENTNCVLVNSEKGKSILYKIKEKIYIDERPFDEAYKYESQLNHPSLPHPKRNLFITLYNSKHSFEKAARASLKSELFQNKIRRYMVGRFVLKVIEYISVKYKYGFE